MAPPARPRCGRLSWPPGWRKYRPRRTEECRPASRAHCRMVRSGTQYRTPGRTVPISKPSDHRGHLRITTSPAARAIHLRLMVPRVLVVEDEMTVALLIEDMVTELAY